MQYNQLAFHFISTHYIACALFLDTTAKGTVAFALVYITAVF